MNTKIFLSAKEWGEYFSQTVLTYPEQIRVLKRCGMIIHDWEEVESRLKHIGKTTLLPYLLKRHYCLICFIFGLLIKRESISNTYVGRISIIYTLLIMSCRNY